MTESDPKTPSQELIKAIISADNVAGKSASIELPSEKIQAVVANLGEVSDENASPKALLRKTLAALVGEEMNETVTLSRTVALEVVGVLAMNEEGITANDEKLEDLDTLPEAVDAMMDTIEGLLPGELKTAFNTQRVRAGVYMAIDTAKHDEARAEEVAEKLKKSQGMLMRLVNSMLIDKPLDGSSNDVEIYIKASLIPMALVALDTISGTLPGVEIITTVAVVFVLLAVLLKAHGFDRVKESGLLSTLTQVAPRGIALIAAIWFASSFHIEATDVMLDPSLVDALASGDINQADLLEALKEGETVTMMSDTDLALAPKVAEAGGEMLNNMGWVGDKIQKALDGWRHVTQNYLPIPLTIGYGILQLAKGMSAYLGAAQMSEDSKSEILQDYRNVPDHMKVFLGELKMGKLHNLADTVIQMLGNPRYYILENPENAISILRDILQDPELEGLWAYDPDLRDQVTQTCLDIVEGRGYQIDENGDDGGRRRRKRNLIGN